MGYLAEYVLSNYFTTLGIISIIIKIYPYVLLYIKFIFCIVILFNSMTIYNDYYLTGVQHFLLPKNFLKPYFRLIILSNFPYFYVVCAVCI